MNFALLLFALLSAFAEPSADRYNDGEWSWCDVHLLAKKWGVSDQAAVKRLTAGLAKGQAAALRATVNEVAATVTPTGFEVCPAWEAGYTYEDAEALAKVWGMSEAYEAKGRIESKLIHHNEEEIVQLLRAAGLRPPAPSAADERALQGWALMQESRSWTQCDLEIFRKMWGTNEYETKLRLGRASNESRGLEVRAELDAYRPKIAEDTSMCAFWSLGTYTYEDAVKLGKVWGISVSEAKAAVERKARMGYLDSVESALGRGNDAP